MKIKLVITDVNYPPGHEMHVNTEEEWDVPDGEPVTLKFGVPWLSDGGNAVLEITP